MLAPSHRAGTALHWLSVTGQPCRGVLEGPALLATKPCPVSGWIAAGLARHTAAAALGQAGTEHVHSQVPACCLYQAGAAGSSHDSESRGLPQRAAQGTEVSSTHVMGPALHWTGALIWPVLSHRLTVPSTWPTQHTCALLYSMQLTAACGCSWATLHSDRFTLDSCAEPLPRVATHTCTSRLICPTTPGRGPHGDGSQLSTLRQARRLSVLPWPGPASWHVRGTCLTCGVEVNRPGDADGRLSHTRAQVLAALLMGAQRLHVLIRNG